MDYIIAPIEVWPVTATKSRRTSQFKSSWSKTVDLLERELDLNAKHIVIQADVSREDVRLDGMLRANARPKSPRVIISFGSKYGNLSYPCDTFTFWQDNVRAIALALESLRKVDRYGVTRRAEQYKGWAKIEDNSLPSTIYEAATLLSSLTSDPVSSLMENDRLTKSQLRTALAKYHPDCNPSGSKMFKRLAAAKDLFEKHFSKMPV